MCKFNLDTDYDNEDDKGDDKTVSMMMTCSPKFMGDGAALAGFELGPGHDGDEVITASKSRFDANI